MDLLRKVRVVGLLKTYQDSENIPSLFVKNSNSKASLFYNILSFYNRLLSDKIKSDGR